MNNERVVASVVFKSKSGLSIIRDLDKFSFNRLNEFSPKLENVIKVAELLAQAGFAIEAQTDVGISFSGPKELFQSEFGVSIRRREMKIKEPGMKSQSISFFESSEPSMMSDRVAPYAEAINLASPAILFHNAVHPTPSPSYYFLDVLNDLPNRLNVVPLHASGITGAGVRISMVDSGFVTRVKETHQSDDKTHITVEHKVRHVQGVWLATDPGHTGKNYFTNGSFAGNKITLGKGLPNNSTSVEVIYSSLHPHYLAQNYDIDDIRAIEDLDVNADEHGHGTAEAANALAVAPKAKFSFVKLIGKISDKWYSYPLAGFQAAVQKQNPQIITCSWGVDGSDQNLVLLEVANAVSKGIVVIFCTGNGQIEADGVISHPNLISVGGAYPIEGDGFRASNYSSSFESVIYTNPQRHCPDVVGLVGERPNACLIMLPTEPNNFMDKNFATGGDNTAIDDGWCVCSGTSAAAPQVAGLVALLLQKHPGLSPMAIKNILENTARDIQVGSGFYDNAAPGWDAATGFGLIDGKAAVSYLQAGRFNAFIRDSIEDRGTEPVVADRLYASPDIIVRTEKVDNPQDDLGQTLKHRNDLCDQAEDGQENYIYLRVQNRGALAGDCTATVYFTNPGMFSNPTNWKKITKDPVAILDLKPGEFRVIGPIVWPDSLIPAGGHYCLIAVLDSPGDPAPNLDSIHSDEDFVKMVRDKNNVSWKNIDVVDVVPGGSSSYSFYMEGPQGTGHQADLQIDLTKFPATATVLVKIAKRLADTAALHNLTVDHQFALFTTLNHLGGVGELKGMDFKSNEKSKVTIYFSVPDNTPDGNYSIIAALLVDGKKIGSYSKIVNVSRFAFVGNRRSREVHKRDCLWVKKMSPYNRMPLDNLEQAHKRGFDNCGFCIGGSLR